MDTQERTARIVVGVDGSPSSQAALRWAVRYAGLVGGQVDVVTAWEIPGEASWSAPAADGEFDQEDAEQRLLEEVRTVLGREAGAGDAGPPVHERVVHGHPAAVLVEASEGADLLVVGSHGRGAFRRALLGSVSQQVTQHASCPVTIVRQDLPGT
ncbi:universal stress protein [Streptomyces xanthii]|uniref:Universal stress protein n=1 Tax=Streptomyces xanthii TaxID=2768069 RepID=A0A7H1BG22_9ACTN|nr:universal stress protein [Streptomyces xanthii]QNS07677.1 universal stress protein [Streptomyces xanthii]